MADNATVATNQNPQDVRNVTVNPLSADVTAQLEGKLVELKDAKFSFRKVETTDELGKTVYEKNPDGSEKKDSKGKLIPVTFKRPTLSMRVPLLTRAGLIAAIESGDKSTELALDMANSVILDQVRAMLAEAIEKNPKIELTPDVVDQNKLGFLDIANLPRSARGAGISKEEWETFGQDYIEVMQKPEAIAMFPDHKPRAIDILQTHVELLTGKYNQIKSRKDLVEQMDSFLDIWAANTTPEKMEENSACYSFLKEKAQALLNANNYENL